MAPLLQKDQHEPQLNDNGDELQDVDVQAVIGAIWLAGISIDSSHVKTNTE
jgi:hypothetical protein